MKVLVAYSSRYGATAEIAERIAGVLAAAGNDARRCAVEQVRDLAGYDAFVLGSALYFGDWRRRAVRFARRNAAALSARPLWLFSSGPLGTERTDAQGPDLRIEAEPKVLPELRDTLHPRDHRVFPGALDPRKLGLRDRLIRALPAGRGLLPEGDFRDWQEIEAWAVAIGRALANMRPDPAESPPSQPSAQ